MAESGSRETSPHHAESTNVHQQDEIHGLEHEKGLDNYREGSLQTLHTGGTVFGEKVVQCISKVMKKLCNERSMS